MQKLTSQHLFLHLSAVIFSSSCMTVQDVSLLFCPMSLKGITVLLACVCVLARTLCSMFTLCARVCAWKHTEVTTVWGNTIFPADQKYTWGGSSCCQLFSVTNQQLSLS